MAGHNNKVIVLAIIVPSLTIHAFQNCTSRAFPIQA